jgi:hypothetical protein
MSSTSSTGTVLSRVSTRPGAAGTAPAVRAARHAERSAPRQAGCAAARAGGRATRPVPLSPAEPPSSGVRLGVQGQRRAAAPRAHLTARGRAVVVVGLVLLLLAAFSLGRTGAQGSTEVQPRVQLEQTTVLPGDTLWGVAKRLAPGQDPRPVVDQIRRLNGLSGAELQAGQQLLLPVAG